MGSNEGDMKTVNACAARTMGAVKEDAFHRRAIRGMWRLSTGVRQGSWG
jgi:hypothetical protein